MPKPTPNAAPEAGIVRGNHVCWAFETPDAFRERAVRYFEEGLAEGNRLAYVGSGTVASLGRELEAVPALRQALRRGDLTVRSLDDRLGHVGVIDPVAQVATYASETQAALADGYTGLRIAVNATPAARTPEQREAVVRYEHLIDRFMVAHPLFILCGYSLAELGPEAVAEVACVHPRGSEKASSFRWWAEVRADVGLAGEVDLASRGVFDVTLARTMPLLPTPEVTVEASGLAFIDHQGLLALEQRARQDGRTIVLRTDSAVLRRVAELLDLRAIKLSRHD